LYITRDYLGSGTGAEDGSGAGGGVGEGVGAGVGAGISSDKVICLVILRGHDALFEAKTTAENKEAITSDKNVTIIFFMTYSPFSFNLHMPKCYPAF
jgi:hypothetical protein